MGVTHCWEDGDRSTCLLPDGHDGPHEFTPDSAIVVQFDRTVGPRRPFDLVGRHEAQPGGGPTVTAEDPDAIAARLDAARQRHVPFQNNIDDRTYCDWCQRTWPCEQGVLLAEVDRLAAALRAVTPVVRAAEAQARTYRTAKTRAELHAAVRATNEAVRAAVAAAAPPARPTPDPGGEL